ncbi:MAG: TrpB-like pyridoxal phosphate-dependent enzyme [Candidatus Omnitrophica bacterium]|nr:TrpB-like pyridoxal phosphate-dependent enzyme [Candidatus Omnitrophota bacterium]
MNEYTIPLSERELPREWYNIQADLPFEVPRPVHPLTHMPLKKEDLRPLFPDVLIDQEFTGKKWVRIPAPVRDAYRLWRPTPLKRARRLEKQLKTTCRIYYKDESVSPTGSHKTNTAVAQAYFNMRQGVKRLTTETGAGQWGAALSFACNVFSLKCRVFMVKVSFHQKPFRKSLMHIWGSEVFPSPSHLTASGRKILQADPHCQGSLGMAISEAVEEAVHHRATKYSLGSVLNHVLLHQTVIGMEAKKQLKRAGETPDYLIGCVGGGSNFGGFVFPFLAEVLRKKKIRVIATEPTACPTLTKGLYKYDFGDTSCLTPLIKMYTLGHGFVPPGIHSGGLRYHGCSSLVSALRSHKIIEARAFHQTAVFKAAVLFAKTEGIVPAPESAHAVKAAVDVARKEKNKTIVFNLSGHGFLDLSSYDKFLKGELKDFAYPVSKIKKALKEVPASENG